MKSKPVKIRLTRSQMLQAASVALVLLVLQSGTAAAQSAEAAGERKVDPDAANSGQSGH